MLADQFRAGPPRPIKTAAIPAKSIQPVEPAKAAQTREAEVSAEQRASSASLPAVQATPILVKSEAPSNRAPAPTTRAELVQAIGKELSRLGFYRGPIPTAWTKELRAATQRFSGKKAAQPTKALLAALQGADKPANRQPSLNLQQVTLPLQTAPAGRATASRDASQFVQSDGYLPPWESLRAQPDEARATERMMMPVSHVTKRIAHVNSGKAKRVTQRWKRSEKRRSQFANASFSWPGL